MKPIRRLAFVVNETKEGASALADELGHMARAAGVRFKRTAKFPLARGYLRNCDACCVIGGDGTLLGVARESAREQVPIIGVNRGSLGFLTTFSADEARAQFTDLLQGHFRVDARTMLECSTGRGSRDLALNDVLVKAEVNSRLVRLEVFADGELVTDYTCDGLIFSTPTGSTAYNLSAGGPILHPAAGVVAMTPICPHTLSNRAIIFRDNVKLRVFNRSEDTRLLVAMDGQRNLQVGASSPVEITASRLRLPLAQRDTYSHFSVVRAKLKWSGGFVEKRQPV
jgi:NAD+ kinase